MEYNTLKASLLGKSSGSREASFICCSCACFDSKVNIELLKIISFQLKWPRHEASYIFSIYNIKKEIEGKERAGTSGEIYRRENKEGGGGRRERRGSYIEKYMTI